MKKDIWEELGIMLILGLSCVALWFVPGPQPMMQQQGKLLRAKVLSVDNANLKKQGMVLFGSQKLEVQILVGKMAGKKIRAANELRAQLELDKVFKPGDTAVIAVPDGKLEEDTVLTAQDHDRRGWLLMLSLSFCVALGIFGGWTGMKALFSFVLSCLVIWKGLIPLALRGWSASWTSFGVVCFLTAAIQFLVAGVNRKGLAAFAGAMSGVFAGLCMAHMFTALMKINGAILPYSQTLLFSGYDFLDLQDVFVGAMMLSSSGAVMDLAMDIAAGVDEVARHAPGLSARKLMASGMRIGRSVVGTMTTTLLLAYSGGYITLLMMFSGQGNAPWDFINNPLVASEAVKTLVGSFGLLLVAPFTAVFSGWMLRGKYKSENMN